MICYRKQKEFSLGTEKHLFVGPEHACCLRRGHIKTRSEVNYNVKYVCVSCYCLDKTY